MIIKNQCFQNSFTTPYLLRYNVKKEGEIEKPKDRVDLKVIAFIIAALIGSTAGMLTYIITFKIIK